MVYVRPMSTATRARLFDRNSYQLAITPEGRAFADSVQEAFSLLDDAFHRLEEEFDRVEMGIGAPE